MSYQKFITRLIPVLMMYGLYSLGISVSAATIVTQIDLENAVLQGCSSNSIEGSMQIVARDTNGDIVNSSTPLDFLITFTTDNGSQQFSIAKTSSENVAFAVQFPGSFTIGTMRAALLSDFSIQSTVYILDCTDLSINPVVGGDGRLNANAGDLVNVLYTGFDITGNLAIDVYTVDGETGKYFGQFPYKLFQPYLNQPPTTNTRLATVDQSTLYALVSGEFQIDVGPDVQGKVGKVIFNFPLKNIRTTLSDPGQEQE